MISAPTADEAVVSERFIRDFGFEKPADAVGKTFELLAPPEENPGKRVKTRKRKMRRISLGYRWTIPDLTNQVRDYRRERFKLSAFSAR